MRAFRQIVLLTMGMVVSAVAQVPDSPQEQRAAPAPRQPGGGSGGGGQGAGGLGGQSNFLGGDVPFFDPGSELLTWDGRSWNVSNNRLFQSRFEKYLNAEEETDEESRAYQALLRELLDKLAPGRATVSSADEAFQLLPKAARYPIDANLCDALANAVYTVWLAKREDTRLAQANRAYDRELKQLEWNAQLASETVGSLGAPPKGREAAREWAKEAQLRRELRTQPYLLRLAEVRTMVAANRAKRELSELQTKIEFQALIVQLFMQRRFQHVAIGTRFYRHLFSDGDTLLRVGDDAKNLFSSTTGMPPTVGVLDSLANEAMRDAAEGVQAYAFLLGKNELESATKRLAEAFVVGEYLPELRTVSRDDKRQALLFTQKANQLVSALEVKDYALAESIVKDLDGFAKDFDPSKPLAAIETARTVSAMHLAKAKNAAVSGDTGTLEAELKEATAIWPRNPDLAEVSKLIFSQADVQQRALMDLDQLLSQRNYRQIFDDQMRFIAAAALFPDRQDRLRKVLEDMTVIETAIIRSTEIAKRGDYAGAWENVERVFQQFPDDNKLNQVRANLTTQAAEFVRTLRKAEELESRGQTGSSLAWYLKAQQIYPGSEFAREGVTRLVSQIVPEGADHSGET
jgi:hypothetical protein